MTDAFRTNFEIQEIDHKIDYHSKIFFAGSCFSENISDKLQTLKFRVLSNPFGIIYNPVSLAEELQFIMSGRIFSEEDIFCEEGVYRSFYMHSRISHQQKAEMLAMMHAAVERGRKFLQTATHIILTPGTTSVYVLKSSGKVVANNHKQPAHIFDKKQLSFAEVKQVTEDLVKALSVFNPELKIVFTVSPVRHFRDGAVQNMRSKATLLSAIHEVKQNCPEIYYFPAYEIMMDDLRDYRFYAEDMLHPNTTAVTYIFEKFKQAYIHPNSYTLMQEIQDVKSAMQHKPFFPESEQHALFKKNYLLKVHRLQKKYTEINFEEELSFFGI